LLDLLRHDLTGHATAHSRFLGPIIDAIYWPERRKHDELVTAHKSQLAGAIAPIISEKQFGSERLGRLEPTVSAQSAAPDERDSARAEMIGSAVIRRYVWPIERRL
jgi:hypothetical protein